MTAGRGPGQRGWYEWIARQVSGTSVLDAGCGLGYGLEIIGRSAREVLGQDVDPRLARSQVRIGPLESFGDRSVDVVTSVDVIEHIEDDRGFVSQLVRIARRSIIMTTPNWTAGRGTWPYHVREYTPEQLRSLCERFGSCTMWKGTPDGNDIYPIKWTSANNLINKARATPFLSQAARVVNFALPSQARIHSHLAIVVDLTTHRSADRDSGATTAR